MLIVFLAVARGLAKRPVGEAPHDKLRITITVVRS